MENSNVPFQPFSIIYSPISINALIDTLVEKVSEKLNSQSTPKNSDIKDEIIRLDTLLKAMNKSRPTINTYIRKGKLRSHYFDDNSPVFFRQEVLEDIKLLPGYEETYRKLITNNLE